MLTLPLHKETPSEPLTLSQDLRIVRIINDLIENEEVWLDYDEKLIQRMIDWYRFYKDKEYQENKNKK